MSRIKKEMSVKRLFYITTIIFVSIFLIAIQISHGVVIKKYLFADKLDTFMDFFNSVFDTIGNRPYSRGTIYPPLCYMIYSFFLGFIPSAQMTSNAFMLRIYQGSLISFMIYFTLILYGLGYLIIRTKKGTNLEKKLFLIIMLFSTPFLYAFERGNIILLSLICLLFFLNFKDSKNKFLKELALISLATSAALKIYPAIYGVILLKEKRYKESIRVAIYGMLLFFIPFLCFGGFATIGQFFNNLMTASKDFSINNAVNNLGYTTILNKISMKLNLSQSILPLLFKLGFYISMIICFISSFISKSFWKTTALLTIMMIAIPSISFTYAAIFMVIPIMYLLDEKEHTKIDYFYIIIIVLMMFPNPICLLQTGKMIEFYSHISWNSIITIISLVIIMITLNIDIIYHFIKNRHS